MRKKDTLISQGLLGNLSDLDKAGILDVVRVEEIEVWGFSALGLWCAALP